MPLNVRAAAGNLNPSAGDNRILFVNMWDVPISEITESEFKKSIYGPQFATAHNYVSFCWRLRLRPNLETPIEDSQNSSTVSDETNKSDAASKGFGFFLSYCGGSEIESVEIEYQLFIMTSEARKRVLTRGTDIFSCGPRFSGWGTSNALSKNPEQFNRFRYIEKGESQEFVKFGALMKFTSETFDPVRLIDEKYESVLMAVKPFGDLFDDVEASAPPKYSDFVMTGSDGKRFFCHKVVLARRSDYFNGMFESNMMEVKQGEAKFQNYDGQCLREVLHFIYLGVISPKFGTLPLDNGVDNVLDAAEFFQLPGLKALCHKELTKRISIDSVAKLIDISERYADLKLLRTMILNFFAENAAQVMQSDTGKKVPTQFWKMSMIHFEQRSRAYRQFNLGDS